MKQKSKSALAAKRQKLNPPVGEILRTEGAEAAVALKPTKQKAKLVASGNRRRKASSVFEIHRLEEVHGAEAAAAPVRKNLKTKSTPVAKRRQDILPISDNQRVEETDGTQAPLLPELTSQKTRSVPASKRRRKKTPLSGIQRVEEVEGAEALVALEPTVRENLNTSCANRKRKSPFSDIQTMEEVVGGAEVPALQMTKAMPVYKRRKNLLGSNILRIEEVQEAEAPVQGSEPACVERQRKDPPVSDIQRTEEIERAVDPVLLEPSLFNSDSVPVAQGHWENAPLSDIFRAEDRVLDNGGNLSIPNSQQELKVYRRREKKIEKAQALDLVSSLIEPLQDEQGDRIDGADPVSTLIEPLQDQQGDRVDRADPPAANDIITMIVPKPVLRRHRKKLQLPDFVYDQGD